MKTAVSNAGMLAHLFDKGPMTRRQLRQVIDSAAASRVKYDLTSAKRKLGSGKISSLDQDNRDLDTKIRSGKVRLAASYLWNSIRQGYVVGPDEHNRYRLTRRGIDRILLEAPDMFINRGLNDIPEPLRTGIEKLVIEMQEHSVENRYHVGIRLAIQLLLDYCISIGFLAEVAPSPERPQKKGE